MTHTPGPWHAEIYCVWAGDTYVAGTQTNIPIDTQKANARLIAAAPDLLAALQALEQFAGHFNPRINLPLEYHQSHNRAVDAARVAIAKAIGDAA